MFDTSKFLTFLNICSEQPGPDSIGIVAISHGCTGVAARACGLVGLEPTRVSASKLNLSICPM